MHYIVRVLIPPVTILSYQHHIQFFLKNIIHLSSQLSLSFLFLKDFIVFKIVSEYHTLILQILIYHLVYHYFDFIVITFNFINSFIMFVSNLIHILTLFLTRLTARTRISHPGPVLSWVRIRMRRDFFSVG